ncbi:MAG: peptide-methionine (S)-S-oxide reductase MsrA [Chitinophagales bacterium]|nr:peptide-methionine (S)-S-oxide reductase MsrA [Bacteroidota bacterium]MCB9256014.1 peptide-methionine (S)-S-oxide reductase MsrA [Chitinophagales bacterium]
MSLEIATIGGGCFWCIEALMQQLEGVEKVVSGYAGGSVPGKPTYREVCSGLTGHAEVTQVSFDPAKLSYEDLLMIFMTSHDPTTLNRQGADVGTQYRSIIMYHSEEQKATAEKVLAKLASYYSDKIVTSVEALTTFYEAEEEHQNYYNDHPEAGFCKAVIEPKVSKLRQKYQDRLKS